MHSRIYPHGLSIRSNKTCLSSEVLRIRWCISDQHCSHQIVTSMYAYAFVLTATPPDFLISYISISPCGHNFYLPSTSVTRSQKTPLHHEATAIEWSRLPYKRHYYPDMWDHLIMQKSGYQGLLTPWHHTPPACGLLHRFPQYPRQSVQYREACLLAVNIEYRMRHP